MGRQESGSHFVPPASVSLNLEVHMIYEICLYLKNWFDLEQPKHFGKFTISNGAITEDLGIQENQYYRIVGSVFNDGVYQKGKETLTDETFKGAVWEMALPVDFLALVKDISDWQAKYGSLDSENMSPFQSESFGGYSYSKASGGNNEASGSSVPTWQSVFGARLRRYKKI